MRGFRQDITRLIGAHTFVDYSAYTAWDKAAVYAYRAIVYGYEPGTVSSAMSKYMPTPVIGEPLSAKNTYNFFNPCRGKTVIRFSLKEPEKVSVNIYDINGNRVWSRDMSRTETRTGINYVIWNAVNDMNMEAANGICIYKIITKDKVITKKIVVIK